MKLWHVCLAIFLTTVGLSLSLMPSMAHASPNSVTVRLQFEPIDPNDPKNWYAKDMSNYVDVTVSENSQVKFTTVLRNGTTEELFSGRVEQIYFPLEYNPTALAIFEQFGIQFIPIEFRADPKNRMAAKPETSIVLISENYVLAYNRSTFAHFFEFPLPIDPNIKNYRDRQYQKMALDMEYKFNILSYEYLNTRTNSKTGGTYVYNSDLLAFADEKTRVQFSNRFEKHLTRDDLNFHTDPEFGFTVKRGVLSKLTGFYGRLLLSGEPIPRICRSAQAKINSH